MRQLNGYCLIFLGIIGSFLMLVGCKQRVDQQRLAKNYHAMAIAQLCERAGVQECSKRALVHIDQALALDQRAEYKALRATLLFNLGMYEQSAALFKKLLEQKLPAVLRPEVLNNYACVLAAWDKQDQALQLWKDLRNDPAYLTPEVCLVNMGKVYAQNGQKMEALECFRQAATLAPEYLDAHFYAAVTAQSLGDTSQGITHAHKALALEPEHKGVHHILALLDTTVRVV